MSTIDHRMVWRLRYACHQWAVSSHKKNIYICIYTYEHGRCDYNYSDSQATVPAHFRLQYYLLINFRLAGTRLNVTLGNVVPRFEIVFQDVSHRLFHNVNVITHRSNYPSIIIYTHVWYKLEIVYSIQKLIRCIINTSKCIWTICF